MAESHLAASGWDTTSVPAVDGGINADTVPIMRPDERIWPANLRPSVDQSASTARVRTSAALGAGLSLAALCAVLAGLLGAQSLALAVPGVLFSIIAVATRARPGEGGRGLAIFGLICGFVAVLIGVWS
jgi:hypothetical protein